MKFLYTLLLLALPVLVSAEPGLVGACKNSTITTAPNFELSKYTGLWYEIGHSKSFYFDHDCQNTTAEYTLIKPNDILVNNSCDRPDKSRTIAIGEAVPVGPGHLKVYFSDIHLFSGSYYVVHLSDDLSVSWVASCSELGGSDLWLLSRERIMTDIELTENLKVFEKLGFLTDDFIRTKQ